MKYLIPFLLIAISFASSGCQTNQGITKMGGQAFRGVYVTKGKSPYILGVGPDYVHITNACPDGYLVDFREGTETIWEGIAQGDPKDFYPKTYRNNQMLFSAISYKLDANKNKVDRMESTAIIELNSWQRGPATVQLIVTRNPSIQVDERRMNNY